MKRIHQGFIFIPIIVILIVISSILVLVTYFISKSKQPASFNKTNNVVSNDTSLVQGGNVEWSVYSNSKFKLSLEYPTSWTVDEKLTKTIKGKDWLLVELKEKQYREGMGTSWFNIHAFLTLDLSEIQVFGKKVGNTIINGAKADIWGNPDTNQKYLLFQTKSMTYMIQSRIQYKSTEKDIEQIYNHLLNSFKIESE